MSQTNFDRGQRFLATPLSLLAALALLAIAACGGSEPSTTDASGLTGTVSVDGSSTVFPITEAIAEEFRSVEPDVRVPVGASGTGGGFKKFISGETDINDASRPIKESERRSVESEGFGFIELPVAFDGLSVVVHPENDWVDHLTVEELAMIWGPESTVETWSDVRADWPDEPIALYGPGADSGTFDYFTEVINGSSGASRADYTSSEDDNVIVTGVTGDRYSLGYFGFAYFNENRDLLKVVPVDGGEGPVEPTEKTINEGTYAPLSRPIFIYVRAAAAERPEVERFVEFYLEQAAAIASEVGYVALPEEAYEVARRRFDQRVEGTVYGADAEASEGLSVAQRFSQGL